MNFENIEPRISKEHGWTEVVLPMAGRQHIVFDIVREFHTYDSRGRYSYDTVKHGLGDKMYIWFELKQDATYFALKYAS